MSGTKEIINNLKSGYGCIEVYPSSHVEKNIFIYCDGNRINENSFQWKIKPDTDKARKEIGTPFYLTLDDISNQWFKKHKSGVLTVLIEDATQGTVYQCGRHNKEIWEKHGVTEGYC